MSDRPIIAALINAVKELSVKVSVLTDNKSELEAKFAALEARLTALEG